jgi:hypothetical protein
MSNYVNFGGIRVDTSQFDLNDHSSRVADVHTANIILIVVVVSVVSLRLFARIRYVKRVFTDDSTCIYLFRTPQLTGSLVLIVLAAVFTLALASTCIAGKKSTAY